MALTAVGRYQVPAGQVFYLHVQDPDDLDSMYMLGSDAGTWKVYKFTWPDTLAVVATIGTYLTGKYIKAAQIVNGNFAWGLGYLDSNKYYCFTVATAQNFGSDDSRIYDVNVATGDVTYYSPGMGPAPGFEPWVFVGHCRNGYDGTGTYTYMVVSGGGHQWSVIKKYIGVSGGSYIHDLTGQEPILAPDDQNFVSWDANAQVFRKYATTTLTNVGLNLGSGYLPTVAVLNAQGWGVGTFTVIYWGSWYYPYKDLTWDDNNRYIMMGCTTDTGRVMVGVKKNVVTGQYSLCHFLSDVSAANWQSYNCFDLWKDAGGKERFYYTTDGTPHLQRIYADYWPFTGETYLTVDTGTPYVTYVQTAEGGYSYVYHYNGSGYASCITKIYDDEFVADAASPAISAPGLMLKWKDKRVFFSGVSDYERFLWWAQPYEPQALDIGWDGYNTTVFDDEDVTSLIVLEDTLYIGSKKGWMRLRGKTPDHWALDLTLATYGPLNDKAVSVTPFGAIYPRSSGLYLFNGYTSRLFFEKGKGLMENINWDSLDKIFSIWDGRYYRLYYPKDSATSNDRELIVDMIAGPDSARGTEGDRAASAGWADIPTGTIYLGDESGNILTEGGGSTSRDLEITTKEYPAQGLIQAGQFSKLHYDIDCAGASVYITPIYDGTAGTAILIPTNNTRTRGHILLPKGNAYRVGIKITVSTTAAVKIYEPWVLE